MSFLMMFYPMTLTMAILFTQISHPLAMGLSLLLQTILICCCTGLTNLSFWFSYILFLIFLGGMLVLFIYITSLASNEMFKVSVTLMGIVLMTVFISVIMVMSMDNMILPQMNSFSVPLPSKITPYTIDSSLTAMVYSPTNFNLTIFMVFYLLLTLIVVVKITNMFFGPLRLSMN